DEDTMRHHLHSRRSRLAVGLGATLACGLIAGAVAPTTVGAVVPSGPARSQAPVAVATSTGTANVCRKNAIDVPRCGVLWGLFDPAETVTSYRAVETTIGRPLDLLKTYVD